MSHWATTIRHMDLTTKISKAVDIQLERVNALHRSLRWLPKSELRKSGTLEEKIITQIIGGKFRPPDAELPSLMLEEHRRTVVGSSASNITEDDDIFSQLAGSVQSAIAEEASISTEPTTFVSGDILDMLTIASETVGSEPLHATDLIAPTGFVYLEKPLVVHVPAEHYNRPDEETGIRGETVGIRAFSWRQGLMQIVSENEAEFRTDAGIWIYVYTDYGCVRYVSGFPDIRPEIPDSSSNAS